MQNSLKVVSTGYVSAWRHVKHMAGTPWHGTDRGTRRFMARPGTENHGTENLGTARHGKSWHGKILARHGPEKYHKNVFFEKIFLGRNIWDFFIKCKSHHLAILINIWHIWEDRSRKVNMNEPDLRFFHGNFWPVIQDLGTKILVPRSWYLPFLGKR